MRKHNQHDPFFPSDNALTSRLLALGGFSVSGQFCTLRACTPSRTTVVVRGRQRTVPCVEMTLRQRGRDVTYLATTEAAGEFLRQLERKGKGVGPFVLTCTNGIALYV